MSNFSYYDRIDTILKNSNKNEDKVLQTQSSSIFK